MGRLKPRTKRISLDFMGEGWQDCYIEFAALQWRDIKGMDDPDGDANKSFELGMDVLKRKFVSGQGLDAEGNTIALTADDLEDLDIETLTTLTGQLGGTPGPNA